MIFFLVMNWQRFIKELFARAQPYLTVRDDFVHTQVVHAYAVLLLEKEGGDKKIVEPAVILHDVGWSQLKPEQIKGAFGVRAAGEKATTLNRVHEIEGARIARQILEKLAYETSLIEKIARIIERHDSGNDPQSIEEKLVKDADRLWRFSKIGYAHEMRRQNLTHAVRYHFLSKNLGKWFFTKTARKMAQTELRQRAKEMTEV